MENSSKPERVLIVDDDEAIRRLIHRSLQRMGYEVLMASDGEEGLRLAAERVPDLILLDIRMPGIDGHTFLRRLPGKDRDTAVVVMSGAGTMDDVVDVMRSGAVDYLKKPWTPSELLAVVARAMEVQSKRRLTPKPTASPEVKPNGSATTALLEVFENQRQGRPPPPPLLPELRALEQRPDFILDSVVALLEQEPTLAHCTLRLARSGLHGKKGAADLRSAVAQVGLPEIRSLACTLHVHQFVSEVHCPPLQETLTNLWTFSLARALSMRALADVTACDGVDAQVAYQAGLLCDLGAAFLLKRIAAAAAPAQIAIDVDACLARVRLHHSGISSEILSAWGLDPNVARLAAAHHGDSSPSPSDPYWSILVLGGALAAELHPPGDITSGTPVSSTLLDRCAAELGVDEAVIRRLREMLRKSFEEVMRVLVPGEPQS